VEYQRASTQILSTRKIVYVKTPSSTQLKISLVVRFFFFFFFFLPDLRVFTLFFLPDNLLRLTDCLRFFVLLLAMREFIGNCSVNPRRGALYPDPSIS